MPHTYYIDSASGNDANAGTSADTAFKSITALDGMTLQPGDTVLLARSTSYGDQLTIKGSGTADRPITVGAYGEGAAPLIKGASTGIYGDGTHNIIVHDIAIADTSGYAILGSSVDNWTIDNVTVSHTGSATHSGAVSFEDSSNIAVKNSTISGVTGDGMLINGGHDITVSGNHVNTVQGPDADNVQVNDADNVTVTGNHLDMSAKTSSTKGNLVVNHSDHVDIEHNTLTGGKYGASVNSDHVTIASNDIHGQQGYDWSFGIGAGENWNVSNYDIHGNTIYDVANGVALTGDSTSVTRSHIDITDNTFDHIGEAALKVDRAASGEFSGNHIGSDSDATQIPDWISAQGKFLVSGNDSFDDAPPVGHPDTVALSSDQTQVSGNVLDNDESLSGGTLSIKQVAGHEVGDIAGKYGVVSIDASGNFVYHVNAKATAGATGPVSDSFSYVVTDGHSTTTSKLEVDVAAGGHSQPVAVNDSELVTRAATVTGNVLANDRHGAGETLHVRSVGGDAVGSTALKLAGHYGTLSIGADGAYSFALNDASINGKTGMLHDSFTYKMSDGSAQDTGHLDFVIDAHAVQAASDFHM